MTNVIGYGALNFSHSQKAIGVVMKYVSTRSNNQLGSFSDILLMGLAPDGGLVMPETIPVLSKAELEALRSLSYTDLAYSIMRMYITDIPENDLKKIINATYIKESFGNSEITPLFKLGDSDLYILELSNGPSLAFKDIAMQFLGNIFEYTLNKQDKYLNILGATSGDTGSAAEYAMLGKNRVNVFMLSPNGRMSSFQKAQMYSLSDENIFNIALEGVFDDCQDLVKAINYDASFKNKYNIGAVNSINWARILAQSVYYFKAYFSLNLPEGAELDFCVPSGNFGNVFAGYLAKSMGLPVGQLIVASNENDVLNEFFETGVYNVRPANQVAATSSPSMDIGKASNFERYLYLIANCNHLQIKDWWEEIDKNKSIDIKLTKYWEAVIDSGFKSGRSSHSDRLKTIKMIYDNHKRIIDPHTADGIFIGNRFLRQNIPMICLETALPAKFEDTVKEAIGHLPSRPSRFNDIENKKYHYTVMANNILDLKNYIEEKLNK